MKRFRFSGDIRSCSEKIFSLIYAKIFRLFGDAYKPIYPSNLHWLLKALISAVFRPNLHITISHSWEETRCLRVISNEGEFNA